MLNMTFMILNVKFQLIKVTLSLDIIGLAVFQNSQFFSFSNNAKTRHQEVKSIHRV